MSMRARRRNRSYLIDERRVVKPKMAVAAMVGRRHETAGDPCEDVVGCLTRHGTSVIALADGAGSAKMARIGATVAVNSALNFVTRHFDSLASINYASQGANLIASTVFEALQRKASMLQVDINDLATTLLIAATNGKSILIGQIGDGRIGVKDKNTGEWHLALDSQKGEFANQTYFVTSKDRLIKFQLTRLQAEDLSACVLMSDGAEESLFNKSTKCFAPAMNTLLQWLQKNNSRDVEIAYARALSETIRVKTLDDVSICLMQF